MKLLQLLAITACIGLTSVCSAVFAQTTYTGVFRSLTNTSTYDQFNRQGTGAAIYIC